MSELTAASLAILINMKNLILFSILLTSFDLFAAYQKPRLLARYLGGQNFLFPENSVCFSSEPAFDGKAAFLGCQDEAGAFMWRLKDGRFDIFRASQDRLLSRPLVSRNEVTWYEFSEWGTTAAFAFGDHLRKQEISNLGPLTSANDSFLPVGPERFIYRLKDETQELKLWRQGKIETLFKQENVFIFPPLVSSEGKVLIKIRREALAESAPDELWLYESSSWKKILADRDADPSSR
jgi:hypothetical protein